MLDLKWVVANLDEVRRRLLTRGAAGAEALAPIEPLASERRQLIQSSETQRAEQRKASEQMRTLKGEEQAQLRSRLKALSDEVKEKDARLKEVEQRIERALLNVPNLPHETVPPGSSERDNQVVRVWGDKPGLASPREHTEIGEKLGLLDFERAAKVSGARFVFYRGALARLELALVQFFLDSARERGYLDLLPPYLVNADSMRGTGQLPKFEEDLFTTIAGHYLIPTAAEAGPAPSRDGALHRRPGVLGGEDVRPRSVAAGAGRFSRDQLLLDVRRLSGAPSADPPSAGAGGEAAAGCDPQRQRPRGGAHGGGDSRERPAGGRERGVARGDPALPGRPRAARDG